MPTTITDIARELNLSAMTVSRILRQATFDPASVTHARVFKAAAEMGYRPNRHAQALISGRTRTIALWIDHVRSSVYAQIADACREAIEVSGMQISVCEMGWHFAQPGHHLATDLRIDGILAVDPPSAEGLSALIPDSAIQAIPRVNLGSGLAVPWAGDSVRVDLQAGTRSAIEHLLRAGCRRIAYALPAGLERPGAGNSDSYQATMLAAGCRPEFLLHPDLRLPAIRRATREYLQQNGRPDGFFCHNDEMAIATFRALRDAGLGVPEDVLLIGCEGNEFMGYFDPPLSTIEMPIKEIGRTAWQLLKRRISQPDTPPEAIILPYRFHARESSTPNLA